jgi:hypothetical protein
MRPRRLRVKGSGQKISNERQRSRTDGQDVLDPLTMRAAVPSFEGLRRIYSEGVQRDVPCRTQAPGDAG